MRAIIRSSWFGFHPKFLEQSKPSFSPYRQPHDVLVEVKAAALNPFDFKVPKFIAGPVVGIDFCGTVKERGNEVTGFQVGDEVFGAASSGALADFTIAKSSEICKVPVAKSNAGWTATHYAALPTAYESVLQALRKGGITDVNSDDKNPTAKKSVLVIGASGGTGIAALQLCKALGVPKIVAICSGRNKAFVKSVGATEVIDYTKNQELEEFFEGAEKETFDCILDLASGSGGGESYLKKCIPLLRQGKIPNAEKQGQYVALNGSALSWFHFATHTEKSYQHLLVVNHDTEDQKEVLRLLDLSNTKPIVSEEISLTEDQVKKGYELLMGRHAKGKIVVRVQS